MRNLAIIPARSGSKGLPDKNVLDLGGRPMMSYTIEAARDSALFDKVFVSTDSADYARIAEGCGAEAQPLRPPELSGDGVGSMAVILYVLEMFPGYETFCLLQPTSPFRTAEDIERAYRVYDSKGARSVVSLTRSEKSPRIINRINADGTIQGFVKIDQAYYSRQNEEDYYAPNGALFICNVESFLASHDFYGERSYPYVMPKSRSIDVDDQYDYLFATSMLNLAA